MRSALLAALLPGALAIDANVYGGAWELVVGSLGKPPTGAYGHAAIVPGYLMILGNDSSTACSSPTSPTTGSGCVDLWRYNIIQNSWVNNLDYPSGQGNTWPTNPTGYAPQPVLISDGGQVIAFDELAPNTLFTIDSLAPSNAGWSTIPVSPTIPISMGGSRFGQRFLSWGSSIFMFGGVNSDGTNLFRQDMWALELQTTIAKTTGWTQVSPPAGPNGLIGAGWPEGRVGPSWTGYTVGALLFGGVATTDGSPVWPACMQGLSPSSPAPSQCVFYQSVWAFLPGSADWFSGATYTNAAWVPLPAIGANGGPVPAGRTEHVAGSLGDQLFIWGGITANGPVTAADALWTYNIVSKTWSNLAAPGGNAPPTGPNLWSSGTFMARHLYVWQEQYNADGSSGGGQLWRYAPDVMALPAPGGAPAAGWSADAAAASRGHTAGIVIGILLGLGNLYFLYLLVANAGIDILPASLAGCSLPSLGGGAAASRPAPSFYAQVSSSADEASYKAPSSEM